MENLFLNKTKDIKIFTIFLLKISNLFSKYNNDNKNKFSR